MSETGNSGPHGDATQYPNPAGWEMARLIFIERQEGRLTMAESVAKLKAMGIR